MKLKELFYLALNSDSDFVFFIDTIAVRSGYKLPLTDSQRNKILSLRLGNNIALDDDARGDQAEAAYKLKLKNKRLDNLNGPA